MNKELRSRLSWWRLRARRERDPWVRFILYYFIFDAFITDGSGSGSDKKKIRWFLDNPNSYKTGLAGCWTTKFLPSAQALKQLSPIQDMRPGITRYTSLNNVQNLEDVFKFIYQIRCNLFHGSKDRTNGRDESLVSRAGELLKGTIDCWLM